MTSRWSSGVLVAVMLCGCPKAGPPTFAEEEITWPPPPEAPQVRWVGHIATSRWAAPPTRFQRFLARLSGNDSAINFKKPYDVVVDLEGRVFVSDTGWGKVMVFDRTRERFGWLGDEGQGTLQRPFGMAADSRGHLFVADGTQARVFEYDADLRYVRTFGAGVLEKPVGVAVHEERREVWVTDIQKHSVEVFRLDGPHDRTVGGRGTNDGRFNYPTSLVVGPGGEVFVADTFNFRIQVLDSEGNYLRKWGQNCDGYGCMGRLKGIDVDEEGRVFAVDAAFNVVQVFDPEGGLLMFFGGVGNGPGRMWLPAGIDVGEDGRVFVVSQYNWRVNEYRIVGTLTPREGE